MKQQEAEQHVGKFARSIESGWLGKIVGVEVQDGLTMFRMKGVNTLTHTVGGGNIDDHIDEDDTQWFTPEDVRFVKLV